MRQGVYEPLIQVTGGTPKRITNERYHYCFTQDSSPFIFTQMVIDQGRQDGESPAKFFYKAAPIKKENRMKNLLFRSFLVLIFIYSCLSGFLAITESYYIPKLSLAFSSSLIFGCVAIFIAIGNKSLLCVRSAIYVLCTGIMTYVFHLFYYRSSLHFTTILDVFFATMSLRLALDLERILEEKANKAS